MSERALGGALYIVAAHLELGTLALLPPLVPHVFEVRRLRAAETAADAGGKLPKKARWALPDGEGEGD